MNTKCITISGGFDSGCLPFLLSESMQKDLNDYDFIFFNYNQNYLVNEFWCAEKLGNAFKKDIIVVYLPDSKHDQERRNFIFLSKLKELGYQEVVMGNRGLVPWFDRFKDSNFISLKQFAKLLGMKVKLPITGWTKKKVIRFLFTQQYVQFYNCYKNNNDFKKCDCSNCAELRRVL